MKKLLVSAIVVLMASPAFAAIQNVKVSGDITSTVINRNNFNLGITNGTEYTATSNSLGATDITRVGNQYINDGTPLGAGPLAVLPSTAQYVPLGLKRQNVFITQTRVRIDADLSDNVSTTVGLINERAWNAENTSVNPLANTAPGYANDTGVQLYLASVTMRELLYSPLTVTVGRQVFNYGNGLILGDGGVNNQSTGNLQYIAQDLTMRTSYDGVKAVLDYKPLTIDMFYFKNNQAIVNGNPIADKSSSDAFGINADYQLSDPWSTVLETYIFSRINGTATSSAAGGTTSNRGDTLFVPGLRASTNPVKGLNVQGEVAWQFGNHPVVTDLGSATDADILSQEAEKRHAMAAQLMASYALPVLQKYKPSVNASYTYVSGDRNGLANLGSSPNTKSAKIYTAWDPFNENQGGGTIYNTLFPLSNMHILALGASANPLEDVTTAFTWTSLWAADYFTSANPLALFQPDGGTAVIYPITRTNNRALGNEYDVNLTYNYTEDVTFGVSVGWFVPGDVFLKENKNTASQALADVAVKF